MSIEADIFTSLSNHAGLSALVSSRIYPLQLPQFPTLPAISYQRISTVSYQVFGGTVAVDEVQYQITIWASTYASIVAVAAQLRVAVLALVGDTVIVHDKIFVNEIDSIEPVPGWFRRDVEIRIQHQG